MPSRRLHQMLAVRVNVFQYATEERSGSQGLACSCSRLAMNPFLRDSGADLPALLAGHTVAYDYSVIPLECAPIATHKLIKCCDIFGERCFAAVTACWKHSSLCGNWLLVTPRLYLPDHDPFRRLQWRCRRALRATSAAPDVTARRGVGDWRQARYRAPATRRGCRRGFGDGARHFLRRQSGCSHRTARTRGVSPVLRSS